MAESEAPQGCQDCGSLTYSRQWADAFGVRLCNDCRALYSLISKGNAKEKYAVTDADLRKVGFLQKENPRHKMASPMHLLLECQVEEISIAKHGTADRVELILEERRTARSGVVKQAKQKAAEKKAQHLKARVDRVQKRISATTPQYRGILSSNRKSGQFSAAKQETVGTDCDAELI